MKHLWRDSYYRDSAGIFGTWHGLCVNFFVSLNWDQCVRYKTRETSYKLLRMVLHFSTIQSNVSNVCQNILLTHPKFKWNTRHVQRALSCKFNVYLLLCYVQLIHWSIIAVGYVSLSLTNSIKDKSQHATSPQRNSQVFILLTVG